MVMYVGVSYQGEAIANREESLAFTPMFYVLMVVGKVFHTKGPLRT